MKITVYPLLMLLLTTTAAAAPAEAPSRAETLVRAMRSDELAVSAAKRAFASGAIKDYAAANTGCLRRVNPKDFTARFSRVVEQVLTPSEIETALSFYESPAGVKYVELGEDSWLPKIAGVEDISPEERDAISAFASSELGRKIAGKQMTESPAALQFGREMVEEIGEKCSKSGK
jgi:hypothetical protein